MNQSPAIRRIGAPTASATAVAVTIASLLAGLLAGAAVAAVNTWQGATTAWATPGNWSLGVAPNATHEVVIDGGGTEQPTLDFDVSGSPGLTIAALTVGETAAATLTFHDGNVSDKRLIVTGNVTVGTNGVLTHTANSSAETHRLFLDIGGNLTVEAGGVIDVVGRGYGQNYGPGCPTINYTGGSHGGIGAGSAGTSLTYGSAIAPTNLGSGGRGHCGPGGGAIRLSVTGIATVDGVLTANGGTHACHGTGSGGSIFLTTDTLLGDGTIRANGGQTDGRGGGGGRVSVILTGDGMSFGDFNGAITAHGSAGSARGAAGTVYLETMAQGAGRGDLIIDNAGQTTTTGVTTIIPPGATWDVYRLTTRENGLLEVPAASVLNLWTNRVESDAGTTGRDGIRLNGGTLELKTGALRIADWTLVVDGQYALTGTVTVGSSGLMTHTANSSAETYLMRLTVDGDLTVEAGGAINVLGRGYAQNYGPGCPTINYTGGSHGGIGAGSAGTSLTYGSAIAPTNLGSGGRGHCGPGGGAIRLSVTGIATVDGVLTANGGTHACHGTGSGGSIFLTTHTLLGDGTIRANGGQTDGNGGGGGRVSLILTGDGMSFGDFNGAITAHGSAGSARGAAGTVYLETPAQGAGGGDLIIDNANQSVAAGVVTSLDDTTARTVTVGSVIIRQGGRFHVGGDDRIEVVNVWTNGGAFTAAAGGTVAFVGTDPATVYGNTTFANLECVTPRKGIAFEAGKTFAVTNSLLVAGTAGTGRLVTLTSTTPGMPWYLTLNPGCVQDVAYVGAQDSNADGGQTILAVRSSDLGDNSNWNFTKLEPIRWTGGAGSSLWTDGDNWDLGRAPLADDPLIVIAPAAWQPILDASRIVNGSLLIKSNAELRLGGYHLTVHGVVTNRGVLTAAASETLSFRSDVVFTAASDFNAAASTVVFDGATEQAFDPAGKTFYAIEFRNDRAVTVSDGFTARDIVLLAATNRVSFEGGLTATNLRCVVNDHTELSFGADRTATIAHLLLRGVGHAPVILRSTADGHAWRLHVTEYAAVRHVDVRDSDASGGNRIFAIDSVDRGGNRNWDFNAGKLWTGETNNDFHNAANWLPSGVPTAAHTVFIDGTYVTAPQLTAATTLGGLIVAGFVSAANLTFEASFATDDFLTVTGDAVVGDRGTLTHRGNSSAETYRLVMNVSGNLTVGSGGAISAFGRGYAQNYGPGCPTINYTGGSHGGIGAGSAGTSLTYGSVMAPVSLGSGGRGHCGPGGGAIRLKVTGMTTVNGMFDAEGGTDDHHGAGAGGSVYLTTGSLSGRGTIHANGGICQSGGNGGGGGRVAVLLTGDEASFDEFGGVISARGGGGNARGAAGTVYLGTRVQGAGHGTVLIDNHNQSVTAGVVTHIPPAIETVTEELKGAAIVVTNRAVLTLTAKTGVHALTVATTTEKLELGAADVRLTVCGMLIPDSAPIPFGLSVNQTKYTRFGLYSAADWNGYDKPTNVSGAGDIWLRSPNGSVLSLR